jgi:hypothetical protein
LLGRLLAQHVNEGLRLRHELGQRVGHTGGGGFVIQRFGG